MNHKSRSLHGMVTKVIFAALISVSTHSESVTPVPFRWTPGQIEIQVSVNGGASRWFIVDTGAEFSILGKDLAASLGLPTTTRGIREFASGVRLSFAGITLKDNVMVMPFDNFKMQHRTIEGIIGYELFARYVVRIDYAGRTLEVFEPSHFVAPKGASPIPLQFASRLAVVPLMLRFENRDAIVAHAIIDTGASQVLILRTPFVQKHDLLRLVKSTSSGGSLELRRSQFAHIPARSLSLGGFTFDEPVIRAYTTAGGAGGITETDGALGNEILRRFRVTLDYGRKQMWLEPNEELRSPFPK